MNQKNLWLTGLLPSLEIKLVKFETVLSSDLENTVHPDKNPPTITTFTQVSEDEVRKIISSSPTKSCLLDPWPTFLMKDCIDILLPSITKLVNCSLAEGIVPTRFKQAVVTPLIKKELPSRVWTKFYVKVGRTSSS